MGEPPRETPDAGSAATREPAAAPAFPAIAEIGPLQPLGWLQRGWSDLRACTLPSLFYGLCFAVMGVILQLVFERAAHYTSALASGFLLVAPFLAVGLYELSRRREAGAACRLVPTLAVWRRNAGNIGVYALVLIVVFLVWARASLVIFALFYTSEMPNIDHFMAQVLRLDNLEFLAVYAAAGFVFALLVFAFSVVSIPMMLDRNQDAITAMIGSFIALARNLPAMVLWAALIVSLVGIGFATFYVGLVVTVPLVGHATWHAYRDLVRRDDPASDSPAPAGDAQG